MPMTGAALLPARLMSRVTAEYHKHVLERDFTRLTRQLQSKTRAVKAAGPRIGIATFGSFEWHLVVELLLGHSLALRGARPELLICDLPGLPICGERLITSRHQERCAGCLEGKRSLLDAAGLPWRGVSAFVSAEAIARAVGIASALDRSSLESHVERGWPVGRWLHVSGCHFLRGDERGDAAEKVDTRRRLLATAIVIVEAVERWLDEVSPDVVLVQGGAHVMWRIARELAQARGIPVIAREMGKGGWDRHIYALDADCMAPDLEPAWSEAQHAALSAGEEAEVDALVASLPVDTYTAGREIRAAGLCVPAGKKIAVAFTNVTWDLATAGRDVAFAGVFDWVGATMQTLGRHPGVHLIVRVHPAEASVLTRERMAARIAAAWPEGLSGVTIIEPGHVMPARELFARAEVVLAYNSTAGLEAAISGRPVIVCGAPHYRGKGFTIDLSSREAYAAALDAWAAGSPVEAPPGAVPLARRYFHLFFARYHVPMAWTTSPLEAPYRLLIASADELEPGRNASLDLVCDGILNGRQVLRPRVPAREATCT